MNYKPFRKFSNMFVNEQGRVDDIKSSTSPIAFKIREDRNRTSVMKKIRKLLKQIKALEYERDGLRAKGLKDPGSRVVLFEQANQIHKEILGLKIEIGKLRRSIRN